MKENWSPHSWKFKKALHQPVYDNVSKLNKITKKMKKLPPLVFAGEVRELKCELAKCADGKGFCFKQEIVQRVLLSFIQIILEIHLE